MTEPTTAETTIEQAVIVLNKRQWRGRDDWRTQSSFLLAGGPRVPKQEAWSVFTKSSAPRIEIDVEDALAIASGLLAQEELQALRERLVLARGALNAAKITHLNVEDCWYSCPESSEGCCDESQTGCNCGADEHNAAIDVALSKIGSVDTTERAEEAGE